ncbi:HepT-like ribonuclease domain-containing protein [uncultured Methanobrevibacter sp.]
MRNVTAPNYENIIDDIIWEVMHDDVPEIKEYLEKILYH